MAATAVVTGAFGNIGRAVAAELLARGWTVRTLTNRSGTGMEVSPLVFDAGHLRGALRGADVLVNTYWVRLPRHGATFAQAVANSRLLVDAAKAAGVRRIVQVSVSNARVGCGLDYYHGKALVDEYVRENTPSWAIVRPTLVVGPRDVLTGNIAWFLRRLPLVLVPSGGDYPLQPVVIDDAGRIIADQVESTASATVDAAGPERYPFAEYVRLIAAGLGRTTRIVAVPPRLMLALLALIGSVLGDVVLAPQELAGLRDGMLVSNSPPLGDASVRAWLLEHAKKLGRSYTNDMRTRRRSAAAAQLPR